MTTTTDTKRQQIQFSIHLGRQYGRFAPHLSPASREQQIACVEVTDGLRMQTSDPSIFRELAAAFLAGADSLDLAAHVAAPRCTKCSRALIDDDPSNTGLGHHVDCTTDGALAGQSA